MISVRTTQVAWNALSISRSGSPPASQLIDFCMLGLQFAKNVWQVKELFERSTLATAKGFPARGPLKPHWWAVEPLWRFRTQPCQHRPYWCFLTRLPFRSECWSSAIWSSLVQLHKASLFFYESDGIAESEILSARIVSRTSKHRPKVVTKT